MSQEGFIYLLRFSRPLGGEKHKARYYLGWAKTKVSLQRRIEYHRMGMGAKITAAAVARGISLELVGYIPGTRDDERALKNQKNHQRLIDRFSQKETT